MKTSLSIIFLLCSGWASAQKVSPKTAADFEQLSWMKGTWTRTNAKPGKSGSEKWEKVSATEWRGFGVSMKGSDTSFVEKIKILIKDDNIYYVADVPENKQPVYFKLTEISTSGFVCENPAHDFPKKIAYVVDGNKLKATISGDGKATEYLFEKKK